MNGFQSVNKINHFSSSLPGLLVSSLCVPTKDLSSQSEYREYYSDLESSQFLLAEQDSRPSLPSRTSHPQSAVLRGGSDSTLASVRGNSVNGLKSSQTRVRRAAVDLFTDDGSGMEGTGSFQFSTSVDIHTP